MAVAQFRKQASLCGAHATYHEPIAGDTVGIRVEGAREPAPHLLTDLHALGVHLKLVQLATAEHPVQVFIESTEHLRYAKHATGRTVMPAVCWQCSRV